MLISLGLPGNQMLLLLFDFIRELCYRPSTNSSFCTESKECLEYELICKTEEYEVSSRSLPSRVPLSAHLRARARACVCVRRCDTTALPAGCPQTLKPTSWAWAPPWPSGDCSSTFQEPTTEVRSSSPPRWRQRE